MPGTQALGQRRLVERARGRLLCHLAGDHAVDQPRQVAGDRELHPPRPRDRGVARGPRVQRRLHDARHHPLERLLAGHAVQAQAGRGGGVVDGRAHHGRVDARHRHVRAVLGAHTVGVGHQPALGDGVGRGQRQPQERHPRGHEHHPPARTHQLVDGGGRDVPGSEQVDLDHLAGALVGRRPGGRGAAEAGVVDQHVEPAQLGHRIGDLPLDGHGVGDVALQDPGVRVGAEVQPHHRSAARAQRGRRRAAEGAPRAGDQHALRSSSVRCSPIIDRLRSSRCAPPPPTPALHRQLAHEAVELHPQVGALVLAVAARRRPPPAGGIRAPAGLGRWPVAAGQVVGQQRALTLDHRDGRTGGLDEPDEEQVVVLVVEHALEQR